MPLTYNNAVIILIFCHFAYVHLLLVPLTWFIQLRHDGWAAAVVILQRQMWVESCSGQRLQQQASMYTEATAVVVVISVTAAAAVIVA